MDDGDKRSMSHEASSVLTSVNNDGGNPDEFYVPVVGNSMMPMLADKDILVVSLRNLDKIICGDIVIFWNNGLVAH